jgi:amidase
MLPAKLPYRSIAEVQKGIIDGSVTAKALVETYLKAINDQNPELNAVTVTNNQALDEAHALDGLEPSRRGSLHGVPFLVKDQIETAGLATAFGSKACKDYVPEKDATIVKKLRDAGAIILGKSTMPDWAASWFSTSSLSGTTKNPFDLTRDPGGSSSGSGAAVAAGMALAAIGGDTGGSIRLPSSFCGLVGVRVTPGRISRHGMSSLVVTQDTPGPMVNTVEDAARILDVLVGFDEKDQYTSVNAIASSSGSKTPFSDAVKGASVKDKRLGVLRGTFGTHKGILDVMDAALNKLEAAGAVLVDVKIPNLDHYKASTSMYISRSKSDINAFLASRKELSHFKIEELQREGIYHKSLDLIDMLVKGPTDFTQSMHFTKELMQQSEFQRIVASIFAKEDLDATLYPTCQLLAPKTQDLIDGR